MSTVAIALFVGAALLLLIGDLLRERQVGRNGAVGRGRAAHIVNLGMLVCVAAASGLTAVRLAELAF